MQPMLADFGRALRSILGDAAQGAAAGEDGRCRFISTVSAKALGRAELRKSEYWLAHVEQTVNFSGAMQLLRDEKQFGTVVELGPSAVLVGA
eukprot:2278641-Rhodomonas_salina.1